MSSEIGHLACSCLNFMSEASHLHLLFFVYNHLSLFRNFEIFRYNFQNYETVKGGCIPSKYEFKTQKYNKIRWLASAINFEPLHIRCPIVHEPMILTFILDKSATTNHK